MSSIYEFSRHIGKLRSEKKFGEAISFFKENKNSVSEIEIANKRYEALFNLKPLHDPKNISIRKCERIFVQIAV